MNLYRQKLPPGITIERAYKDQDGRDVPDGYDVFINGEWGNRYPTKADAIYAVLIETKTLNQTH